MSYRFRPTAAYSTSGSFWLILSVLAGIVLLAAPATAGLTTYLDEASWSAAHGGVTILEDFESADINGDGDDDGGAEDLYFSGTSGPDTFNGLTFSANAYYWDNGSIDVGDGSAADGPDNGFLGYRAAINGNVVVDMTYLDFQGNDDAPEYVEMTMPPGVTAVSFVYRNGDNVGDGTILSMDGITIDGSAANHSGPAFDSEDPRYFAPADSSRIPGGGTGTGPSFFGIVSDSGPISTLRFTATENSAGSTGSTTFNSFDDVRYEEPDYLKVRINTATGLTEILNETVTPYEIDSYRLMSSTDDLNFSGWSSLSDKGTDAVDGADAGSTAGDGIGETWDEAGGSDDGVLAESFLLGTSLFDTGRVVSLGNAFKPGGDTDSLTFEYRRVSDGTVFEGIFEFVTPVGDADFDGDSDVDIADLMIWQRGHGLTGQTDNSNGDANGDGVVDGADLDFWKSQLGQQPVADAITAVPEPAVCGLLLLGLGIAAAGRRK